VNGFTLTDLGETTVRRILTAVHAGLVAEIEREYGRTLDADERRDVGRTAWRLATDRTAIQYQGRHRQEVT
jgi:hypothetical protein